MAAKIARRSVQINDMESKHHSLIVFFCELHFIITDPTVA